MFVRTPVNVLFCVNFDKNKFMKRWSKVVHEQILLHTITSVTNVSFRVRSQFRVKCNNFFEIVFSVSKARFVYNAEFSDEKVVCSKV